MKVDISTLPSRRGRRPTEALTQEERRRQIEASFRNSGEHLVAWLYEDLLAVARQMGVQSDAASDIVQDCLATFWSNRPQTHCIEAWLRRMVRWRALDHIRRNFRRISVESSRAGDDLRTSRISIEESIDLKNALLELPHRVAFAIYLRFFCGMTETEAAAAVGWAPSSAKNMFSRGLALLRKRLRSG